MSTDILYKDESYKIVGACFEVYREKGCGFLEAVYQNALVIVLRENGLRLKANFRYLFLSMVNGSALILPTYTSKAK